MNENQCPTYSVTGKAACASHYIAEKDLMAIVCADIREKAGEVMQNAQAARERYYALKSASDGVQANADKEALKAVNKRLDELKRMIQAAFEQMVLGSAKPEMFADLARKYEAEQNELTAKARNLTDSIERKAQTTNDVDMFITLMEKYVDVKEIDRATAVELIDHITVSAGEAKPREIVIQYNFIGNVEL